jgi:hypothetical protein
LVVGGVVQCLSALRKNAVSENQSQIASAVHVISEFVRFGRVNTQRDQSPSSEKSQSERPADVLVKPCDGPGLLISVLIINPSIVPKREVCKVPDGSVSVSGSSADGLSPCAVEEWDTRTSRLRMQNATNKAIITAPKPTPDINPIKSAFPDNSASPDGEAPGDPGREAKKQEERGKRSDRKPPER